METDSTEVNGHTVLIESVSPENSVSTEVSSNCGIYGEPEILPKVGHEYQVDIPPLIPVSDYIRFLNDQDQVETSNADSLDHVSAMSIPLMWVIEEAENKDAALSLRSRCSKEAGVGVVRDYSRPKPDPESGALERWKGYRLVPGCSESSWGEIERSGFLLGLYIFGKNLVLVKKLLGSKQMGDILLYYYGKFYRSDMYLRWNGSGKTRNRKCNYGQRIFAGLRHQELLTRLLVNASEDCRNAVMEMSKAFGEGKLSIEEYVFALEAKLGLQALVEAVGIGKGKRDLVGNASDTPKSHQAVNSRREIPAGKPLSALTPKEILSILTGDFRLSKAKSSDIFWESVWPRLLARGWHSEQPGISSNNLVYLKPGIKQFSRSELVKGDDYYDSVTDILNLIASNPDLLEIDGFENEEGNGWSGETKMEQQEEVLNEQHNSEHLESFASKQRHCYLKPRTPSRTSDTMKFTIVDTGRCANGKVSKVRELRSLPVNALKDYALLSPSEEEGDDGDSSEVFDTKTNGLKPAVINMDASRERAFPENGSALLALPAYKSVQMKKGKKFKPSLKEGPENNYQSGPHVVKQRRKLPLPSISDTRLHQETCSDLSTNVLSHEKLSSSTSSSSVAAIPDSHEKPPTRTFIDLNVPVSQTIEIDEVSVMGATERQDQKINEVPEIPRTVKSLERAANPEQEPNVGQRRQSTRNRPLTAKVLEAFAYGYMDTKQKRKAKDGFPGENLRSRTSSRRVRPRVNSPPKSFESVRSVDLPVEDSKSSVENANDDVFNKIGTSSQTG